MLSIAPLALLLAAAPPAVDEKTYMIAGFDRIRVEGPYTVRVITGTSPRARTVGDARAIEGVTVRVTGRTLVVTASINARGGYPGGTRVAPVIEITALSLRGASVVGGGSLTVDRMAGQRVDVSLSGAGSLGVGAVAADRLNIVLVGTGAVTLGGAALDARVQTNGAGTIDAGRLVATALTVNSQGSGEARFAARHTANIFAMGQGSVTVAGEPTCTVRGTAPVTCGKPRSSSR